MEKYDFDDRKQFTEDILKMLERGSLNDVKIILREAFIKKKRKKVNIC